MKVICVDDEKYVLGDLLETISEIPEIQEATGFREVQEALEFLKKNSVQIAFLDIDMPEMTGLELCKKIHGGAREPKSVGTDELAAGGADS